MDSGRENMSLAFTPAADVLLVDPDWIDPDCAKVTPFGFNLTTTTNYAWNGIASSHITEGSFQSPALYPNGTELWVVYNGEVMCRIRINATRIRSIDEPVEHEFYATTDLWPLRRR